MGYFVALIIALFIASLIAFVVNTLLVALAFKVDRGYEPLPFELGEFAWRSALAGLGLTGANLAGLFAARVLLYFGLGPTYAAILSIVIQFPLSAAAIYWFFALEEGVESIPIIIIYMVLSWILLFVVLYYLPAMMAPLLR
jgi:hypothetical protein